MEFILREIFYQNKRRSKKIPAIQRVGIFLNITPFALFIEGFALHYLMSTIFLVSVKVPARSR